jgi:hypothetical protein
MTNVERALIKNLTNGTGLIGLMSWPDHSFTHESPCGSPQKYMYEQDINTSKKILVTHRLLDSSCSQYATIVVDIWLVSCRYSMQNLGPLMQGSVTSKSGGKISCSLVNLSAWMECLVGTSCIKLRMSSGLVSPRNFLSRGQARMTTIWSASRQHLDEQLG